MGNAVCHPCRFRSLRLVPTCWLGASSPSLPPPAGSHPRISPTLFPECFLCPLPIGQGGHGHRSWARQMGFQSWIGLPRGIRPWAAYLIPALQFLYLLKWGEEQHLSSRVAVGFTQVNLGKALGTLPEWLEGLWPAGPPRLLQEGFGAPGPQASAVQGSFGKVGLKGPKSIQVPLRTPHSHPRSSLI